tara:strand:+ start:206 stop:379 length:174 start_codon:yes stop_codon:yes gene_type:complete|eukprot:SAG11_NODE_62_length_19006_cov_6.513143_14_plen_58_part_00
MDKETNPEIKKELEELKETLLNLKLEEAVEPNEVRLLQQKLDKLLNKLDKNDNKNKN